MAALQCTCALAWHSDVLTLALSATLRGTPHPLIKCASDVETLVKTCGPPWQDMLLVPEVVITFSPILTLALNVTNATAHSAATCSVLTGQRDVPGVQRASQILHRCVT